MQEENFTWPNAESEIKKIREFNPCNCLYIGHRNGIVVGVCEVVSVVSRVLGESGFQLFF